ncbi:MAG TPA: hypothetical protein ENJ27_01510 [Candidatus Moranbacteria bacterium]|nr:hypothetical protein [Candidatus Moranbacteria bacterium]
MKTLKEEFAVKSYEEALFFGSMTIFSILMRRQIQQKLFINRLTNLLEKKDGATEEELKVANENLLTINKEVEALKALMLQSKCKPPLAHYRRPDWFAMNEEVICFIDGKFVLAKIYNNKGVYRDGKVSLSLQIGKNRLFSGYEDSSSIYYEPRIIKKWEYNYFCQHPCFTRKWALIAGGMSQEFNPTDFMCKIFVISCAKGYVQWKT